MNIAMREKVKELLDRDCWQRHQNAPCDVYQNIHVFYQLDDIKGGPPGSSYPPTVVCIPGCTRNEPLANDIVDAVELLTTK
jgi:hypothetical protein